MDYGQSCSSTTYPLSSHRIGKGNYLCTVLKPLCFRILPSLHFHHFPSSPRTFHLFIFLNSEGITNVIRPSVGTVSFDTSQKLVKQKWITLVNEHMLNVHLCALILGLCHVYLS
ncbi:hypothetical protein FKM82_013591 [Ascaphus truei]